MTLGFGQRATTSQYNPRVNIQNLARGSVEEKAGALTGGMSPERDG